MLMVECGVLCVMRLQSTFKVLFPALNAQHLLTKSNNTKSKTTICQFEHRMLQKISYSVSHSTPRRHYIFANYANKILQFLYGLHTRCGSQFIVMVSRNSNNTLGIDVYRNCTNTNRFIINFIYHLTFNPHCSQLLLYIMHCYKNIMKVITKIK